MSGAAIRAGRAFVEFFVEDGRLERGLKTIERKLMVFGKRVSNIGRRAFTLATAATIALIFPLTGYAQFDDKIKELESLAIRGVTSMKKLRDQARELGRKTSFTAIEVAGGQTEMARAGFDTDEIKEGIEDIMNLSRATQTELPRATEIAAGALRAFQLPIEDMTRVVNTAVATVNVSAINMEDYAESMKYAAPMAYQFGQSIEETSKQIAILGNMQIKGSLAGTAMRNAMIRIADPNVRKEIEKFTAVIDPATGKIKNLSQIMLELGTATAGEGGEKRLQRMTLFAKMFGLRAVNAALLLSENTAQGFEEAFADPEFAAKIAAHMDSGIGGAWRRLKSSWEGVTIAFGEAVDTMLQTGAAGMTRFLDVVRAIIEKNPILAKGFIIAVASLAVLGVVGLTAGFVIQGLGMVFAVFSGILKVVRIAVMLTATVFKVLCVTTAALKAAVLALATGMKILFVTTLSMTGLLLALALAVAVAAGVFVYMSGAIQKVSAFLRDTFGDAWRTIVGLISSGDLSAAFTLAMALVKATWIIGVSALNAEWQQWTGALAGWLLDGTAAAEIAWIDFTTFLVNAFDTAFSKISAIGLSLYDSIVSILTKARDLFGEVLNAKEAWMIARAVAVGDIESAKMIFNKQQERVKAILARDDKPVRDDGSKALKERTDARSLEARTKIDQIKQDAKNTQETNSEITDEKVQNAERDALKARASFDQAQAKADAILNPHTPPDDEKKKKDKEAQGIRDLFSQGPAAGRAASTANDAMLVQSKEGAAAIARALGAAGPQDKVVGAIASMQEAVVGAVEDVGGAIEDQSELGAF